MLSGIGQNVLLISENIYKPFYRYVIFLHNEYESMKVSKEPSFLNFRIFWTTFPSLYTFHVLIKQKKKKYRIYEHIKKKMILLILARYVIPRVIWQIGSASVYSTTHVFSMSLESSSRAEWFMLISCLKQLCMGGSWAHSLKCCSAENKSFAYNYIKL